MSQILSETAKLYGVPMRYLMERSWFSSNLQAQLLYTIILLDNNAGQKINVTAGDLNEHLTQLCKTTPITMPFLFAFLTIMDDGKVHCPKNLFLKKWFLANSELHKAVLELIVCDKGCLINTTYETPEAFKQHLADIRDLTVNK